MDDRKAACEAEVTLNARLAPDVYRGVVPVRRTSDGRVVVNEGEGEIVDYAVHMTRLPDEARADVRLAHGTLDATDIDAIATRLAQFHATCRADENTARFGSPDAIAKNVRENFAQTRHALVRYLRSPWRARAVVHYQTSVLRKHRHLFEARAAAGRVRDGHGDLRLEHVYLKDGVTIIDCIEFNERFRYADVCADVAFLSMDLTVNGRARSRRASALDVRAQKVTTSTFMQSSISTRAIARTCAERSHRCSRADPSASREARHAAASDASIFFFSRSHSVEEIWCRRHDLRGGRSHRVRKVDDRRAASRRHERAHRRQRSHAQSDARHFADRAGFPNTHGVVPTSRASPIASTRRRFDARAWSWSPGAASSWMRRFDRSTCDGARASSLARSTSPFISSNALRRFRFVARASPSASTCRRCPMVARRSSTISARTTNR